MWLTREEFKEQVFNRDEHVCVVCGKPAVDAHHILERRLFGATQGYHIDNGASVCEEHHIMCETTEISTDQIRLLCGISQVVLPDHFNLDSKYDKWGNEELPNGQRLKGELFFDDGAQRMLKKGGKLELFSNNVKYSRTLHLPWSKGRSSDDRVQNDITLIQSQDVVVLEKLDGECTTFTSEKCYARSVDSGYHPSRALVKQIWSSIRHDIPDSWRIVGENIHGKHSIDYVRSPTPFFVFGMYDERNNTLSWSDIKEWCKLFGLLTVSELFTGRLLSDGMFNEGGLKRDLNAYNTDRAEGYVIRPVDGFTANKHVKSVLKCVREHHVQTDQHWMHGPVNLLKIDSVMDVDRFYGSRKALWRDGNE